MKFIGTRHGEKLYETLLTKEEMAKAIDMGQYYRIPKDTRDLNYEKFVSDGEKTNAESMEYHSHNTYQLNEDELRTTLISLHEIQNDLTEFKVI